MHCSHILSEAKKNHEWPHPSASDVDLDGPRTCHEIGKTFEIPGLTYFVDGSQYRGSWDTVGIAGVGQYTLPHNAQLDGEFCDGMFHGEGRLQWPRGQKVDGTWIRGRLLHGGASQYTFQDGLTFREIRWNYCKYPDRRFYISVVNGLRPAGETNQTNRSPSRLIPAFSYDTGNGFFDPYSYTVTSYDDPEKILEIPTKARVEWIKENCRKGWIEPTGYHSWLDNDHLLEDYRGASKVMDDVIVRTTNSPELSWRRLTTFTRDPNISLNIDETCRDRRINQRKGIVAEEDASFEDSESCVDLICPNWRDVQSLARCSTEDEREGEYDEREGKYDIEREGEYDERGQYDVEREIKHDDERHGEGDDKRYNKFRESPVVKSSASFRTVRYFNRVFNDSVCPSQPCFHDLWDAKDICSTDTSGSSDWWDGNGC